MNNGGHPFAPEQKKIKAYMKPKELGINDGDLKIASASFPVGAKVRHTEGDRSIIMVAVYPVYRSEQKEVDDHAS